MDKFFNRKPKTENRKPRFIWNPPPKSAPILKLLAQHYPDAHVTLDFTNPLELLVATILSAQCTDERVNQVTPALFRKYPDRGRLRRGPPGGTGAGHLPDRLLPQQGQEPQGPGPGPGGEVRRPGAGSLEELVQLPGIGRKTANVVLGNAFGIPGIVVDTHCGRVSQRLGLTRAKDPVKIEFDLMALVPRERWTKFSLQLIWHGRAICTAKNPRCPQCPLLPYCDYGAKA